jgi:hypothetical protein
MSALGSLAAVAAPWANFYNDSKVAQSLLAFGHFGGMIVAGGLAIAADRGSLQTGQQDDRARRRHLEQLSGVHPVVIGALVVTSVSGLLMFAADIETLSSSPWFWIKMSLFGLLLANGWVLRSTEGKLVRETGDPALNWRRLRRGAAVSLTLWLAVVLAGTLLTNLS